MSAGTGTSNPKVSNDLGLLAPAFAEAVKAALEECNGPPNDLNAKVYEAYRSQELQALYYARGRTIIPPPHTVTNARTNRYSWHGYGLAVDVVHKTNTGSPPEERPGLLKSPRSSRSTIAIGVATGRSRIRHISNGTAASRAPRMRHAHCSTAKASRRFGGR